MTQLLSGPPRVAPLRPTVMRAAVISKPMTLAVHETPLPAPRHNEVRERIEGCGVCASNIPPWEGSERFHYPMQPGALGHEAWGVVDKVGSDVRKVGVGERVAFLSEHAYAEYDVAREDSIVILPESLDGQPF